jgi:FKBP-type peptidyl-prolyl cis-trans isomerase
MTLSVARLFGTALLVADISAWTTSPSPASTSRRRPLLCSTPRDETNISDPLDQSQTLVTRRQTLAATLASAGLVMGTSSLASAAEEEVQLFQLPSGLKYVELKEGAGDTPRYGQLLSIAYKGYIKLPASKENPNPQPQLYGQSAAYLIKHGNSRTIEGLDQGLHTMKVGGSRRLVIPAKMGFTRGGLGPLPPSPWDRYRLNNMLDDMVRLQGGSLVFEVTLLSTMNDEADQGYYEDGSPTPEEFEKLRSSIQRKAAAAKNKKEKAAS